MLRSSEDFFTACRSARPAAVAAATRMGVKPRFAARRGALCTIEFPSTSDFLGHSDLFKLARAKNTTEVRSCLSLAKQGRASPARLLSMDISQVRGERKFVPDCLVAGQLGRNICIFLKNSSPSTFVFLLTSSAIILIQPNNNVPSVLTGPTLTRKQRTSGIRQNSTTKTPCHPTNSGTESTRSSVSGGIYSQGASRNWACRVRRPQRHDG